MVDTGAGGERLLTEGNRRLVFKDTEFQFRELQKLPKKDGHESCT
jgi:hypothetical protein